MSALLAASTEIDFIDPEPALAELAQGLTAGEIIPYLGPGIFDGQPVPQTIAMPTTPEALADFFGAKVALPRRAKGNAWAAAQYVESMKHRATVTALMAEAFGTPVEPTTLHHYLASLSLPLIVDSWYDGAMRAALQARPVPASSWGEVQGISRAGVTEDRWYRFYDAGGAEAPAASAADWKTLLYKPHGGVTPAKNFLISDADYVEVLTEIDIQTPIPDAVKERRLNRRFLFVGCRFHDQLLRTYGRQLMKRSGAEHFVLIDREALTRNEARFFRSQGMIPIAAPIERAVNLLVRAA
jgi:hypothetical protein